MNRFTTTCAVLVSLSLGFLAPARAHWVGNGTPVCIQPYEQGYPQICADGAGGIIMTWNDYRTPEWPYLKGDVYAQRIDAMGNVLWTTNGAPVCLASDDQGMPQICSDGAGGAILVWNDLRNSLTTGTDIYAQRVDANGTPLWTTNGVVVCNAASHQQYVKVVSDGRGGAIAVWQDYRNGSHYDIYAQRIDGSGVTRWTSQGVALCTAAQWQENPQIVSDGAYGAIVAWKDNRAGSNTDIYAQHVDSTGTKKWGTDGSSICWEVSSQGDPVIDSDGMGGAFIVWTDVRNGNADIFAQWVDGNGSQRWTTNGIAVCSAVNNQNYPVVLGNGAYGAFFAWRDQRSGMDNYEFYAQKVNGFGNILWAANGVRIVNEIGTEIVWDLCSDGAGGLIASWIDGRTAYADIYVQRIDRNANTLWTSSGVMVCDAVKQQTRPELFADGEGGCFVVWADERPANGDYDIYAQRVERNGYWGYPSPVVSGVEDVPADQGGEVTVRWERSRLDNYTDANITHYSIWRSLTGPEALAMIERGAVLTDIADVDEGFAGPAIREAMLGGAEAYWEWVGNMDAHFLDHYAYSAATKNDSIPGNPAMEYFFVSAHTSNPYVFWDSPPDSGYSVDNLAPCAPVELLGEQSAAPEGLVIRWDPNTEIDLSHYCVYRGTSGDFVPDPGNRIACVSDTTTFDGGWRWNNGYYYKVSAVDIHGNESLFALLAPDDVTGAETTGAPPKSYLAQNYPNPFNPETTIRFGVRGRVFVSLRVYDAAGRLVRELVSGWRDGGAYRETWDGKDNGGGEAASGVYFYHLRAGDFEETRKMVLVR